jgi:hypothetical protein
VARWTGSRVTADRAYWASRILAAANAGRPLECPFCGLPLGLTIPWDIDHDEKRIDGGILGRGNQRPAHRLAADCPGGGNRADGARAGNARRSRARRRVRR